MPRRIAKSLFECPDELQSLAKFSAQMIGACSNREVVGQPGDQSQRGQCSISH